MQYLSQKDSIILGTKFLNRKITNTHTLKVNCDLCCNLTISKHNVLENKLLFYKKEKQPKKCSILLISIWYSQPLFVKTRNNQVDVHICRPSSMFCVNNMIECPSKRLRHTETSFQPVTDTVFYVDIVRQISHLTSMQLS